jgi:hypothetical protein
MTSAVLGSTTTLKLGSGASPQVWTTVAEVLRIGQVGSSAPEVDVTNLDSTAKEYIGGLPDGAQVEFEFNWIKSTQQTTLRDAVGDTVMFQLTWPGSSSATFAFVVLGFNMAETTPESQLTASISGRITGDITWG